MLVSSVGAKALRDRLGLSASTGAALGVLTVGAIWMFSGFGEAGNNIIRDLPEALSALVGTSGGGNYAVSELFSVIAPVVVLIVAISAGAGAVAGEERDHTADLLLAQPITRRHVVVAKAAALVVLVVVTTTLFLTGFLAASALFSTGVSTANAVAGCLHLMALGVAFGMIALAASAATGSAVAGLGATAGVAVAANLTASLLPLVRSLKGVAKASPWYYYDGSGPLSHGVDIGHLGVLLAIAVAGVLIATVTVDRRDIGAGDQRGLIAMIPALDRVTRPRVGSVFSKALSERLILVAMAGGYVALAAIGVSFMFNGLQDTLASISRDLPEGASRLMGGLDMGTPVGWIDAELLSILLPLVLVGVAVVIGVGAIAGEQKRHTLALLLSEPITRRRVVVEKAAAMIVIVVVIAAIWGVGIAVGSATAGLGLRSSYIAAAMAHLALLSVFFGGVAAAIGAVSSSQVALRSTIAFAACSYIAESFLPLAHGLKGWAALSPWHYFCSGHPLAQGPNFVHLAVLAALSLVALGAAWAVVDRREITA